MRNYELQQKVELRGIEGLIGDKFLLEVVGTDSTTGLLDFMEAKSMAEQVYAIGMGWTVNG